MNKNIECTKTLEVFIEPRRFNLPGYYFVVVNTDGKLWHLVGYYEIRGSELIIEPINLDLPKIKLDIYGLKIEQIDSKTIFIYKE